MSARFLSKRLAAYFTAGAMMAGLAGCSSPPDSYELNPAADLRVKGMRAVVAVAPPLAESYIDSDRILVRSSTGALSVLGSAQWVERLGDLVQSRIVGTFQKAGLSKQIAPFGESSAYVLELDIKQFELDVGSGVARVTIIAKLMAGGRAVAAETFSATAPAPTTGGGVGPRALDAAAQEVFAKIVRWTARRA